MNEEPKILITEAELNMMTRNLTRDHVNTMLDELQQWVDKGKDIQQYILIKRFLYLNFCQT